MDRRSFLAGVSALTLIRPAQPLVLSVDRPLFYRYRADGNHIPVGGGIPGIYGYGPRYAGSRSARYFEARRQARG